MRWPSAWSGWRAPSRRSLGSTLGPGLLSLLLVLPLGLAQGRSLLAGALLDKALEREPQHGEALGLYGDVLVARGDKKAARDFYHRALAAEGSFDRERIKQQLSELQ